MLEKVPFQDGGEGRGPTPKGKCHVFFILPLLFAFGATNHSLYAIHFINLTSIRSCDIQSNVGVDFLTSENFICYELAQSSSAIPKGIVFVQS